MRSSPARSPVARMRVARRWASSTSGSLANYVHAARVGAKPPLERRPQRRIDLLHRRGEARDRAGSSRRARLGIPQGTIAGEMRQIGRDVERDAVETSPSAARARRWRRSCPRPAPSTRGLSGRATQTPTRSSRVSPRRRTPPACRSARPRARRQRRRRPAGGASGRASHRRPAGPARDRCTARRARSYEHGKPRVEEIAALGAGPGGIERRMFDEPDPLAPPRRRRSPPPAPPFPRPRARSRRGRKPPPIPRAANRRRAAAAADEPRRDEDKCGPSMRIARAYARRRCGTPT